jgi:hypothetical protein
MALMVAVVGVRVLHAQDFGFVAVQKLAVGTTNRGPVGAFNSLGQLGNVTGDVPAGTYTDIAAFGTKIVAVSSSGGGFMVLLQAFNDSTFGFPQVIPLFAPARSVAAVSGDIIVVGEDGGFIEVFTSSFVNGGIPTGRDLSLAADAADDGSFNLSILPLINLTGSSVRSVVIDRFNNDAVQDIVGLMANGTSEVAFSTLSGSPGFAGVLTYADTLDIASGSTLTPTILVNLSTPLTNLGPRVMASGPGNFPEDTDNDGQITATDTVDADSDLFIAATATGPNGTITGIVAEFAANQTTADGMIIPLLTTGSITGGDFLTPALAQNAGTFNIGIVDPMNPLAGGILTSVGVVTAGTSPTGVGLGDLNSDGILDVVASNAGNGTITTNLSSTSGGYGTPVRTFVAAAPRSLVVGRLNSDATPDILVSFGSGVASTQGLTGNPNGTFTPARAFVSSNGAAFAGFTGAAGGQDFLFASASTVLGPSFVPNTGPVTFVKIFTATSLSASLDNSGTRDDIVLIEQASGTVFILLNVRADTSAAPRVTLLDLNDLFTLFDVIPTAATAFRDAQTGATNLAITDVGTPTGNNSFGQIIVGLNAGSGLFSDLALFRQFVATPGATNVLSGDFDNSGNSEQAIGDDLVYVDFNSNFAAVALNDGTNFFLNPNFRETGGFIPVGARLGDVNDDDRLDLVVANQGAAIGGGQFNQSVVSVLLGDGAGRLFPTGALLQVPNFALSLVGGNADFLQSGITRIVDFNNDGFPDFAVASTRGGVGNIGTPGNTASITLLLNRPDSPGNFTVQLPTTLVDDTPAGPGVQPTLQLELGFGGPGLVSGRQGDQSSAPVDTNGDGLPDSGAGIGSGGANYVLGVADYNADGSPDLVVNGTRQVIFDADADIIGDSGTAVAGFPGVPVVASFRAAIYLFGNETASSVRVARPLRAVEYTPINAATGAPTGFNPFINGGDTFVANSPGNYFDDPRAVPDTLHVSIAGNIWIDANLTSILNHAPQINLRKADLPNSDIGVGRKVVITAGQTAMINVRNRASDVDGDALRFSLQRTPTGEAPPSFVTIGETTGVLQIASADVNRGPGNASFRIAVEATDAPASLPGGGPGARLPLTGRDYFTLVVLPNAPPTIGAIPNQTIEAAKTVTLQLSITDAPGQTVTASAACDRGNFVSVTGTTLTIAPQAGDVGTATCTVTATDNFGLSGRASFAVTVVAANRPPTIATIAAQTVRQLQVLNVPVTATDPDGNAALRLTLVSGPAFVTLADNGNGAGVIRIAPLITDTQGGRVTVQASDGVLTATSSFDITVQRTVQINSVTRAKPNLFISGLGFGQSGATVSINGQTVSSRIIGQSDSSITLKGSKKKLNLRSGPNQVTVTAGGVTSNTFVLNLLANED